jgi:ADP-heptose:LPS heptosyltransferase
MKILFGKCFGIGNAVMAIPVLKALRSLDPTGRLDVLVGSTHDDSGAAEVMSYLRPDTIDHLYLDHALAQDNIGSIKEYDLAIMSIPFDGRWKNGQHFCAKRVIDGRTRPDPSTTGLVSWKKHETDYQMDIVQKIADDNFSAHVIHEFDSSFFPRNLFPQSFDASFFPNKKNFYLGVGYKKDAAGFWKVKHWGNENYVKLIKSLLEKDLCDRVFVTGDRMDFTSSIAPIMRGLGIQEKRFVYVPVDSLDESFRVIAGCGTYVGNDTGMMHVAASMGLSVVAPFFIENSITKSSPRCSRSISIDGVNREVTVQEFIDCIREVNS